MKSIACLIRRLALIFFSMLRGWHNKRALPTTKVWKRLDLALVTATEPYHLIANLNQSPFNVGEVITLADFTAEQVAGLNRKHGDRFSASQTQQLMDWPEWASLSGAEGVVCGGEWAVDGGGIVCTGDRRSGGIWRSSSLSSVSD